VYDPVEAIGRSRDDLIRGGGAFREAAAALGPVTAKDDSGAVTVTVDAEGRISSILVSMTWRNSYTAHSLAAGVSEAATKDWPRDSPRRWSTTGRGRSTPPCRS
jgi:hypothetical protein